MRVLPNIDLASGRIAYEQQDDASFAAVATALGVELTLQRMTELVRPFERTYRAAIVEAVLKLVYAVALDPPPHGYSVVQWADRVTCLVVRNADRLVIGIQPSYRGKLFPVDGWSIKRWYTDLARNVQSVRAWASDPARAQDAASVAVTPVHAAPADPRTGTDLLAAVVATPEDDAARVVYADWLLEHGDLRGELIRLQCELETAGVRDPRRVEMRARERALLRDHRRAILGNLAELVESAVIRRGLVDQITIRAQALAKHGAAILAAHPLRRIRIVADGPTVLAPLRAHDRALANIPALELEGRAKLKQRSPCAVTPSALLDGPLGARLEELVFEGAIDGPDEWAHVFATLAAPNLASLAVEWGPVATTARELLAHASTLPALRRLRVGRSDGDATEASETLGRIAMRPLDTLTLAFDMTRWDPTERDRVLDAMLARSTALTALSLEPYTTGSDRSFAAIAASPSAAHLQRLAVGRSLTTTVGLATLVRALPELRELTIDPGPDVTGDFDRLVEALLAAPNLKRVRWDRCTLGPARTRRVQERLELVEADDTGRLWLSAGSR